MKDRDGKTALFRACQKGHIDAATLLLDNMKQHNQVPDDLVKQWGSFLHKDANRQQIASLIVKAS